MKPQRKAFTLIELLVVVSIIALLVSILLPALGKAREAAKKVVCMTNLRQVALGFNYYTDDYGMYPSRENMSWFYFDWTAELIHPSYPLFYYVYDAAPAYEHWKDDWDDKYIGDFKVLACPSDKGDNLADDSLGKSYFTSLGNSYWYNCRDGMENQNDMHKGSLMNANPDSIRNAGELVLLGEPEAFTFPGGVMDYEDRYRWHDLESNYANVIFGDFHVEGIVFQPDSTNWQRGDGWTYVADPDRNEP